MTSPKEGSAGSPVAWLWGPPDGRLPDPPVDTRAQLLPLSDLDWKDFERLCLRLAEQSGSVEECHLYGVPGQAQQGIDVLLRLKEANRYEAWQCKRYETVVASDLRAAIERFLQGSWAQRAKTFCFAASASLEAVEVVEEIERQTQKLRGQGVDFLAYGRERLSAMLKGEPRLVDDFFGREWVRLACGEDSVIGLSRRRLMTAEVRRLRLELRRYYSHHFESLDPGLPLKSGDTGGAPESLSFTSRYVAPDVRTSYEATIARAPGTTTGDDSNARGEVRTETSTGGGPTAQRRILPVGRKPVFRWIAEQDRSVLLGEPGAGKSTFARVLILDLLSDQPAHQAVAAKWNGYIPLWIPFGMWAAMVSEASQDHSVIDVVMAWVHRVGLPAWASDLLRQALDDERTFLVVDGLDEATSDTAARTALTLLETFVTARSLPALVTSRPHGFRRLGGLTGWVSSELEDLSTSQQRELAQRWLHHFSAPPRSRNEEADDLTRDQRATAAECDDFFEEVGRDSSLARLAANPLLLTGLITLRLANVRLPRSRFKAYFALLDLLLLTHPRRREQASLARSKRGTLTDDSRARALASLAFETHRSPDPTGITRAQAAHIVASYLIAELGRDLTDARALGEELVEASESAFGILVQRSPDELTFLHRLFQEVLAAKHILRMAFDEQRQLTQATCLDPHWREVLLCVFAGNERSDEVGRLVHELEIKQATPAAESHRRLLLAESSLGDFRLPFAHAERLARSTFVELQRGTWLPGRRALLEKVIGGLDSDYLRATVLDQLAAWFPNRHPYRGSCFAALGKWQRDAAVVEVLWNALHDETDSNREAAAIALIQICGDDPELHKRFVTLAQEMAPPEVTAVALRALSRGWKDEPRLPRMLFEAARSPDPALALVGIAARVERGEHDADDLVALREFLASDARGHGLRRDEAVAALARGWPANPELRRAALEALQNPLSRQTTGPDRDAAVGYLLLTAPQDDEVAEYLAMHFSNDDHPSIWFDRKWELLIQHFRGHRLLVSAVDEWLGRGRHSVMDVAHAALISRSAHAREVLLERLKDSGGVWFWAVDALLEGWPNDPKVSDQLRATAEDSARAQYMAHVLPKLFPDREACRSRLLAILSLEKPARIDYAIRALRDNGSTHEDHEALELVLRRDFTHERTAHIRGMEVSEAIRTFGLDSRIRDLALREIDRRFGEIAVVAEHYADDPMVRDRLLRVVVPLPATLRTLLVERLQARVAEDAAVADLLSQYDQDVDAETKVAASIAHYSGIVRRRDAVSVAVERLSADIRATWMCVRRAILITDSGRT
jgi:hypothetical protein